MWFIWVFQPEMQEKKIKNQKLENQSKRRCGLQDSGAAAVGGQICMVSQEINYLIRGWVGQKKGNYKEREDTIFVLYKICCHAFQCRSDTNVNEEGLTQASFTKALLYLVMNRVVFQSWNKHPENLNRRAKLCWFYRINKTIRLAVCIIYLECLHGFSHCVLSILTFWTSQHPIMQISYEPLLRSAFLWQVRPVKLGLMFIKVKQTAASPKTKWCIPEMHHLNWNEARELPCFLSWLLCGGKSPIRRAMRLHAFLPMQVLWVFCFEIHNFTWDFDFRFLISLKLVRELGIGAPLRFIVGVYPVAKVNLQLTLAH